MQQLWQCRVTVSLRFPLESLVVYGRQVYILEKDFSEF